MIDFVGLLPSVIIVGSFLTGVLLGFTMKPNTVEELLTGERFIYNLRELNSEERINDLVSEIEELKNRLSTSNRCLLHFYPRMKVEHIIGLLSEFGVPYTYDGDSALPVILHNGEHFILGAGWSVTIEMNFGKMNKVYKQ